MESSMEKQVPMTLNQERLLDRGKQLATKLAVRDQMVADEKRRRASAKGDLDAFDAQISKLAETIRAGFENVAQGDLFADQALATGALAEVGKAACTCNAETPGVHDPGCPVHGVDAVKPEPGKLHDFRVAAKNPEECEVCGFDEGSGIHGRHGFVEQTDVTTDNDAHGCCVFCPLPECDEIHQAEPEEAAEDEDESALNVADEGDTPQGPA
jgi:hypothetical protein